MGVFLQLFRPKISLMVGLSSFAGACLFDSHLNINHLYAVLAALFLSASCSAFNQIQERIPDKKMSRTKSRPLPSERLQPKDVLYLAFLLAGLSVCFILLAKSINGLILSGITFVIYNILYTPMKKRTPYALLVGSVTGAIPPMLGFVIAGGSPFDQRILLISGILFIWQTPHFTLLSEMYSEDYKRAGFKTINSVFGHKKSMFFVYIWLAGYISALLLVPVSAIYLYETTSLLHLFSVAVSAALFLFSYKNARRLFITLNISMMLFFLLLVLERIII